MCKCFCKPTEAALRLVTKIYSAGRRKRQRAVQTESTFSFIDPLLPNHTSASLLTFLHFPFSVPDLHILEKVLSRFEGICNHMQMGSFAVNRSLGTSLTSLMLWHLSCDNMQGIMRNIILHLLLLLWVSENVLCAETQRSKVLCIIMFLPESPLSLQYDRNLAS